VHGVIFTSFRDYLDAEHGTEVTAAVFDGEPSYLLSEAYPDVRLAALVERACAQTSRKAANILHGFGVFTAKSTFVEL
jgi:hypothetical protein